MTINDAAKALDIAVPLIFAPPRRRSGLLVNLHRHSPDGRRFISTPRPFRAPGGDGFGNVYGLKSVAAGVNLGLTKPSVRKISVRTGPTQMTGGNRMTKWVFLVALLASALTRMAWAGDAAADADGNPGKSCASYGLTPGTDAFKACVAALTDAGGDVPGADNTQLRQEIERKNAAMRKQIEQQMNQAQHPPNGAPSNCVTTVNGTNRSTVCQ